MMKWCYGRRGIKSRGSALLNRGMRNERILAMMSLGWEPVVVGRGGAIGESSGMCLRCLRLSAVIRERDRDTTARTCDADRPAALPNFHDAPGLAVICRQRPKTPKTPKTQDPPCSCTEKRSDGEERTLSARATPGAGRSGVSDSCRWGHDAAIVVQIDSSTPHMMRPLIQSRPTSTFTHVGAGSSRDQRDPGGQLSDVS